MSTDPNDHIARAFEEGTPIDEAMEEAGRDAVRLHRLMGLPLAVWRDGKTVWVSPDELEAELGPDDSCRETPRET